MNLSTWVNTISLAFFGGCWVLYRYIIERTHETAMLINLEAIEAGKQYSSLTLIKAQLNNIGKTVLQAKVKKKNSSYTFTDKQDSLLYSSSIQVKKINWNENIRPEVIAWHSSPLLEKLNGLEEINLLQGYDSKDGTFTDFWLEPGEIVSLLCPVILLPGEYLIKVIFVGNKRDADYWSQTIYYKKDTILL